jgi:peptidoglycan/LPS O-acetylase OafA/YrhL
MWTGKVTIADRVEGHDNNFNLLRMFAASGVLVSHAYPISLGTYAMQPLTTLLKGQALGSMSVLIFFVISGFFIARSFARRLSVSSFIRARALRLFPALAVMLASTVLVCSLLTSASPSVYWVAAPEYFLRNVTFYFPIYELPGVFETNPFGAAINGSLWTLRCEVTFYMGVAIVGLLGFLDRPMLFSLLFVGFTVFCGITMFLDFDKRIEALILLALAFAIGVSFWVWRDRIPLSPVLAVVGLILTALAWPTPLFDMFLVSAVSYAVFVFGYAKLPIVAAYTRLGDYSYGTYVYAFPIQQGVAWFGIISPLENIAIALPLTLICAVLSWHYVEATALKMKRIGDRKLLPKRGPVA